jgi:hypothetical protein
MRAAFFGSLVLALALSGCAFDENDLRTWRQIKDGDRKLAGYLADPDRDLHLRVLAGSLLLEMRGVAHSMGVLQSATVDDRARLLPGLAARVVLVLDGDDFAPEQKGAAADLGYYLLEHAAQIDAERADKLAAAVADWAVDHCAEVQNRPSQRPQDQLVLAAAVARPESVVPLLLDRLADAADVAPMVFVGRILVRLKDADALRRSAALLLDHARKRYPDIPVALAETMVANGNETLLRFLLETARDPQVPMAVRATAVNEGVDALGKRAVPGLLSLVATDDPAHGNDARWHALDRLWELTGVAGLRDTLHALPPNGTWPREGLSFKADVDLFCDQKVGQQKAAALPVLTGLLSDNNWVARVFAFECIVRLFPDDAPRLLGGLGEDETPLPGWSADGQPTTVGAVVRKLATE